MRLRGIDVSNHQRRVLYDAVKASGEEFVIAKATEGVGFRDGWLDRNLEGARAADMVWGTYHFARPSLGNAAEDEADWYLQSLPEQKPGDLFVLDYEDDWDGDVVGWCAAWLERVRSETKTKPFIYLNMSHFRHDWTPVIDAGYPLWLAYYDQEPVGVPDTQWPLVAMKQWTSDGQVPGVLGRCDRNTFFGTREQLVKYGKPHEEGSVNDPVYLGQSVTVVTLKKGEVGWLNGIWRWPDGRERTITKKVYGETVSQKAYVMYPPADPDTDPTEDLDSQPGVFVVAVSDL